ncbi:AAA family ATPase [Corynebacterium aquatimens]|uniref:Chromosome segregation protein n=1 Tax=Corynebacterium aquatimens TaxID=1190508 RepID=A0A931E181_9CORY|nr:AAA family ATPase [Corynebacterium aquatimens]MBG6121896.1 chromosome segregation protein [Corynebacterium aquatimens]WJY65566.1 Chromosome partition protein Smc [Corynebacterium aquatimens]
MHLTSLTLKGFKSFASATTMKFERGICAVVGPNGSGKSNVVDALAWVMGEQGAKNLRGGKMEDVIFAGAGERGKLGRAEVTLTFDNSDRRLPIEYTEVAITRRMFRDGASEYEINGAKARLMDIQELLSDSGIGREMHIIVGQGKLAEILESRPEDRRSYIEEAAGVLKHRRRKEKAQRKLSGMQADLDRLTDLTEELGKQLKPLARQAEAAQRARSVQAELRDAKLSLAGHQIVTLRHAAHAAKSEAAKQAAHAEAAERELAEAVQRQTEIELQQAELAPEAEKAQSLWFEFSSLSERVSATQRVAAERASHVGAITAYVGQDPEELEQRAREADERYRNARDAADESATHLVQVRQRAAELAEVARAAEQEHLAQVRAHADRREGIVRLIAQEDSVATALEAAKDTAEKQAVAAEELRQRAAQMASEADEIAEKLEGFSAQREPLAHDVARATAEAETAERRLEDIRGQQRERERAVFSLTARIATLEETAPVTDAAEMLGDDFRPLAGFVTAAPGMDTALAAALGPHAEGLVGKLQGVDIVAQLHEASRTVLFDLGGATGDRGAVTQWRLDSTLPAGTSWLLDHVTVVPEITEAVVRLIVDVVVADSVEHARDAVLADPRLRAVTREGVLVGEGWVAAGTGSTSTVEVAAAVARAREELDTAQAALRELDGTLEGAKLAADDARMAVAARRAALKDHDANAESWRRDHARLRRIAEDAQKEFEKSSAAAATAEKRSVELADALAEIRDRLARVGDLDSIDEGFTPDTSARDSAQEELSAARAAEMEATLAARTTQQTAESLSGKGDVLRRQARHEREARARHAKAMEKRKAQAARAVTVEKHARELSDRIATALATATTRRDELAAQLAELNTAHAAARTHVTTVREQHTRLLSAANKTAIAREHAAVRLSEAESSAADALGIAIDDLLADHTPSDDFDVDAQKKRLKRAERGLSDKMCV